MELSVRRDNRPFGYAPGLPSAGWMITLGSFVCEPVEADLEGDQNGCCEHKDQSDRIESGVEGDHGGLTDDGLVQEGHGRPAGWPGVHSLSDQHSRRRRTPFANGWNAMRD